jgi:N-acetylmuramoyl-L-alanine amidase
MTITEDHWLSTAFRMPIPGGKAMPVRRLLVIHFTGGWTALATVKDYWMTPAAEGANAHLIIDRDGGVIQCRPFNTTAGHAGVSEWIDPKTKRRYVGMNSCSIGIELANSGDLGRKVYPKTMGKLAFQGIPLLEARHKNGGPLTSWEKYPDAQLATCAVISRLLVAHYKLDDCRGHEDIAPARKNDPGPAFPMPQFRRSIGFNF